MPKSPFDKLQGCFHLFLCRTSLFGWSLKTPKWCVEIVPLLYTAMLRPDYFRSQGLLGGFALLRQSLSALKGSKGDARRPLLFPAIEASSKQLCNIISNVNNFSTRPDLEESVATVKEIARSCAPTEPTGLFMLVDAIVPALEDESLDATRRGLLLGTLPALLRNLGARLLPKAQQMAKIAKSACHYNSSQCRTRPLCTANATDSVFVAGSIQEQGLDTLQAILQHLSNFVAPFVQDLLAVSLSEDTLVKDRLKALRGALGRQVPIKTLSPALVKAWKPASKQPKVGSDCESLLKMPCLSKGVVRSNCSTCSS